MIWIVILIERCVNYKILTSKTPSTDSKLALHDILKKRLIPKNSRENTGSKKAVFPVVLNISINGRIPAIFQ